MSASVASKSRAASRALLVEPAAGARLGGGREEELHVGRGEDDRADVAPVEHDAPPARAHLALAAHEVAAHRRDGRDDGREPCDLLRANLRRHVAPVELDAQMVGVAREFVERAARHLGQRFRVVRAHVPLDGGEGDGAVHRARVRVEQAQFAREQAPERGLARAGRAVNRDDERFHGKLLAISC